MNLFRVPNNTEAITYEFYYNPPLNDPNIYNCIKIKTNDIYVSNKVVNSIICKILYSTKYINNMVYSVATNEFKKPYLLSFGGKPQEIISSLGLDKKITFKRNDIVSQININFENGTEIFIDGKYNIIFSENISNICLPEEIFNKFNNLFMNNYIKKDNYYELNKDYIPEIKLKINNKTIILNKYNYIEKYATADVRKYDVYEIINENFYLHIQNKPCDNFILGEHFLNLFDLVEYNLETGETSFYLNENRINGKYIIFEKDEKRVIYNSSSYIEFIMLISFIFFSIILIFNKTQNNNKSLEYLDLYNEI